MEAAIILGSILGYLISLVIFYYLVKAAVRNGLKEALRDESEKPKRSIRQSLFGRKRTLEDYYHDKGVRKEHTDPGAGPK